VEYDSVVRELTHQKEKDRIERINRRASTAVLTLCSGELCCSALKQQRENQYLTRTYYTECSTVWWHCRLLISNMLMLVPCYTTSFKFKRISINSARHTIIHSFLMSQAGICAIRDRLSTTSQCRRFRMPALRPDRPSD